MAIGPIAGIMASPVSSTGLSGSLDPLTSGTGGISSPSGGTGALDTSAAGAATTGGGSFLNTLSAAAGQLNSTLVNADAAMANFAAGGSADLHTVILQMQDASLQLKLGVQVRDKLLEAYQDIMRLQV
jgi:flagellar hook-basal body complex protein FliE